MTDMQRNKLCRLLGLVLALASAGAAAQTVVTSTGTTATVGNAPYVSAASSTSTTLSPSPISVSGGNVGIGTTNPQTLLQVGSTAPFTSGAGIVGTGAHGVMGQGLGWGVIAYNTTTTANEVDIAGSTYGLIVKSGNVGFGTTNPSASLTVAGGTLGTTAGNTLNLLRLQSIDANASYLNVTQIRNSAGNDWYSATTRIQQVTDVTNQGYIDFNPAGGPYALAFGSHGGEILRMFDGGNIGIGTTMSGAKLEVNGNIKLTTGSGASITFADGTVQSTAWNGTLCGGDYAETVNASGDHKMYEPGDVLVLSSDNGSDVSKSSQPYSTLVGGIYATKPGLVGRRQKGEKSETEIPMAMVGIVPTKVSTENGPIRRGDLLVTSSTVGHAMKGTDPSRMLGAIVGKALGSLDSGTGVIEVLVSLQ
jgi:hypothetical protein